MASAHAHPDDPHHLSQHQGHAGHGHTIIPLRTLVTVLVILMVFTGLTVAVANLELAIAHAFGITLPAWVNVVVALSIAAVKSIIVAAYFMQLRYDNPLNTMVAFFSILVLTFFLGFTMLDLGTRPILYSYKGGQQVPGGVGGVPLAGGVEVPTGTSVAYFVRQRADATIDTMLKENQTLTKVLAQRLVHRVEELHAQGKPVPEIFTAYLDKHPEVLASMPSHAGGHAHAATAASDANAARPRAGITLPELLPAGAGPAPHGNPGTTPAQ